MEHKKLQTDTPQAVGNKDAEIKSSHKNSEKVNEPDKNQVVSEELKNLKKERDYLKQVLTSLKDDPSFQSWVKEQKQNTGKETTDGMMKSVFGDFLPHMERYIFNTVGQMLQDAMEPISRQMQVLMQNITEKTIGEARERYPNFELFEEDIAQIMKRLPGISIDEAYKIVSFENQKKTAKEEYVADLERKKKAQAGMPGPSAKHFSKDALPKFKDFGDAFNYTESQMGI